MKLIDCSTAKHPNMFAMVDDEDYDRLSQTKWHVYQKRSTFYARGGVMVEGKRRTLLMHQAILKAPTGMVIDHKDWNGLNNQRENLRAVTNRQNSYNQRPLKSNTSGYIGVSWHKQAKKWCAEYSHLDKSVYVGCFDCPIEAAKARDARVLAVRGQYARLNFPIQTTEVA